MHHIDMLAEELISKVELMSNEERKELEDLLLRIRLEKDPTYWERIRKKTAGYESGDLSNFIDAESVA